MMLTGKAKDDFEKWLLTDGNETIAYGTIEYDLYYVCKYIIPQNMVYAKIIEWLDSVGIYVDVQPYVEIDETKRPAKIFFFSNVIDLTNMENSSTGDDNYSTRKQATKAAIEKANELYNKQF